jgi:hypothetical protein
MNRIASGLVGLSALVLSASTLSAQMCNGTAPFSVGPMRAGAGLEFGNRYTGIDGEFAYGDKSGWYGGATLALIDYENTTEGATRIGLNGGKTMVVGTAKKVEMCPQVVLSRLSGSSSATVDYSTNTIGGGASFGTRLDASKSFELYPFGLALLHRDAFEQTNSGLITESSDTNLDITLGAGFVFKRKWTVRPMIFIPITDNNSRSAFTVMGSINFGK